jgi:hypothetical protein
MMNLRLIGDAGAAPRRPRAVKTLAVAVFSLLCAGCTETRVNCRDEVAAAFERLRTSGRPYRKEMAIIVSDQQTYHQIAEYLPPDRMREITTIGAAGYGTVELIRIGARAWSNETGWREWEPGTTQLIYGRGAGMDVSVWPDRAVPEKTVFECLGKVEFRGTAYIGYRAKLDKSIVTLGALSEEDRQKLVSKLQQMPQEWRTVFLDSQSALPAHDLIAAENQLDNPRSKVEYTYPRDIKIEPPVQ